MIILANVCTYTCACLPIFSYTVKKWSNISQQGGLLDPGNTSLFLIRKLKTTPKKKELSKKDFSAGEPCCEMMGLFPVVLSLALIYFCVKAEPNEICQPAGKESSALTFLSGLEKAFRVFSPDERVCSSNRGLSHPCQPALHTGCVCNTPLLTLERSQVKAGQTLFYWHNPCC